MQVYNKTDQRLHQLTQLLAKAGRSFVPQQEDDSHTNLYYDAMGQRILTHPIGQSRRSLAFDLSNQSFSWVETNRKVSPIVQLAGQSLLELEEIIAQTLSAAGLDGSAYRQPLHFSIPDYTDQPEAFVPLDEEALANWQYYRRLANQVGSALFGYLGITDQVRIWPHHFDTGTYSMVDGKVGIGYGLAMQDQMMGVPYFYLSCYSHDGPVNYQQIQNLAAGEWNVGEHWKGAVLPLTDLPPRHAMRTIMQFVQEATNWYLSI